MNFKQKYLKYKQKYLNLKQLGGIPKKMSQLCFGTAQYNLNNSIKIAFENGITHIDCASVYATNYSNPNEYYQILKENIKRIPRENLWITWKINSSKKEDIQEIIDKLECQYIDLLMVHHDYKCNTNKILENYNNLKEEGLVNNFGVSNCENIDKLLEYKLLYNINTVQIQARPPNGIIRGRPPMDPNFIEIMNANNINVMIFSTISGIINSENPNFEILNDVNKYYKQKYCLGNNNVLIFSSITGQSIEQIINDFYSSELLLTNKMNEIERELQKIKLSFLSLFLI